MSSVDRSSELRATPLVREPLAREKGRVEIYDTTLRDGTQREGISLSSADKVRIAERLDALGVAYVEAGFPGSNPKDAEVFRRLRDIPFGTTAIAAFGSTRRADLCVEDDPNLAALIAAGTPVCTIFGKSSTMQVEVVLRISRDENLKIIEESVAFLKAAGRRVFYDAEHFFDGWNLDGAYALETLRAAARGGAEAIVLCDTNGGMLPWMVEDAIGAARAALHHGRERFDVTLGIHAHDDSGCAVANSLTAVRAGARQVQGTINGYGERCGNANLVTLIAGLELKLGMSALPAGRLVELAEVSRFVAEVANLAFDDHAPYVGKSAFAHKGGVHVAAIQRASSSYEHVDPSLVGNQTRVVVSELSGRANVRSKVEEMGLANESERDVSAIVVREIKEREATGASYEAAEASVALMVKRRRDGYVAPFRILDWRVIATHKTDAHSSPGAASMSEATIKLDVAGRIVHTAAEGCGPVAALDAALRKALTTEYPDVQRMKLVDYKVRILDGRDGTAATTRVLVDTGVSGDAPDSALTSRWSTVGAAASIIEASLEAVADGIEYGLGNLARERETASVKTKEVA